MAHSGDFDTTQQLTLTEDGLSIPNLKGMSVVAADPSSLEGVVREALAKGLGVSQLAGCSPKSACPVSGMTASRRRSAPPPPCTWAG